MSAAKPAAPLASQVKHLATRAKHSCGHNHGHDAKKLFSSPEEGIHQIDEMKKKIFHLKRSNREMMEYDPKDPDFIEAVEENEGVITKFEKDIEDRVKLIAKQTGWNEFTIQSIRDAPWTGAPTPVKIHQVKLPTVSELVRQYPDFDDSFHNPRNQHIVDRAAKILASEGSDSAPARPAPPPKDLEDEKDPLPASGGSQRQRLLATEQAAGDRKKAGPPAPKDKEDPDRFLDL